MSPQESTRSNADSAIVVLNEGELSYLEQVFTSVVGGGKKTGHVSVEQALECLEQMDFDFPGDAEDLVKAVVPASVKADSLDLQDVIKVVTSAKAKQTKPPNEGVSAPPAQALNRDDSLMQLESSFKSQMASGSIPPTITEGDAGSPCHGAPPSPAALGSVAASELPVARRRSIVGPVSSLAPVTGSLLDRSESLMVLQHEYGNLEGPEPKQVDLPQRRSSLAARPGGIGSGLVDRPPDASRAFDDDDQPPLSRSELARQDSEAALLASASLLPTIVTESDLPVRRRSVVLSDGESDGISEVGSEEAASAEVIKRELTEAEAEKEEGRRDAERKTAEAERIRFEVEASLGSLKFFVEREAALAQAAEDAERRATEAVADLRRLEAARVESDVTAVLASLLDSLDKDAAIAQAKQDAESRSQVTATTAAAEAAACFAEEAAARLAAEAEVANLQRLEASRVESDVAAVLASLLDSLDKDAAIAQAKQDAESRAAVAAAAAAAESAARVTEETAARLAAEAKAADSERKAEEALRLVAIAEKDAAERQAQAEADAEAAEMGRLALVQAEKNARMQAEAEAKERQDQVAREGVARAALEEEMRVLRSKLKEAREEAVERAREDADAQAISAALALEQARAAGERVALEEAARKVEAEVKAREEAEEQAKEWKDKLENLMREREEEQAAKTQARKDAEASVAASVEEARAFEERKALAIAAAREGSASQDTNVDFENIGGNWWQCLTCTNNVKDQNKIRQPSFADRVDCCGQNAQDVRDVDREDYEAAVSRVKPETWRKSTSSKSTEPRPRKGDVCAAM